MLHDVGQSEAAQEVILGEEWSDKVSFNQVIQEYIRPFVSDKSKVLEIGIGGGRVAKRTVKMAAEVHGLDISAEMIKKAKANLSEYTNVK